MKSTMLAGIVAFVTLGGLSGTASAAKPYCGDEDITLKNVEIRAGVTDDVHLHIHSNPHASCKSKAILAVHGATATAATWESMAKLVFASGHGAAQACKFVAMDLPGHGGSSQPHGALLGDLTLDDYAAAVLATLDRLAARGIHVKTLMGHSMGGMVVQLMQQDLVDQGSSLRDAFGIKRVVLLAPAVPQSIPSAYSEDPSIGPFLAPFLGFDPVHGARFSIPDALWPVLAFTKPNGTLASNAPTSASVTAHGYNSTESLSALGQLLGAPPAQRPDIDAGIFAADLGTRLDLVTFENDIVVRPEEGEALYQRLTGDDESSRFTVVAGANAVHGLVISDPAAILAAMAETAAPCDVDAD